MQTLLGYLGNLRVVPLQESSLVPMTVEYLFYLPLCFSVDNYGQWVIFHFLSCDQVIWSQSKLHYIEHWMELLHLVWQP